jgi:predicted transcriptional regulator with HTH domain
MLGWFMRWPPCGWSRDFPSHILGSEYFDTRLKLPSEIAGVLRGASGRWRALNIYVGLGLLILVSFVVTVVTIYKRPERRNFANLFFLTLVTFIVAVDPRQHGRLLFMLASLTVYAAYLLLRKK